MSSQSTHTKPEKTMRILYAYTEFRNQKGQPSPCRGFEHFEINLGKRLFFHYEDGTLHVTHRDAILPEGFWGKNIYNVTTLAGDNGSGKTTILNCVIELMRQTWHGRSESVNRSILVLEDGERLAAVYAPGAGRRDGRAADCGRRDGDLYPAGVPHGFAGMGVGRHTENQADLSHQHAE